MINKLFRNRKVYDFWGDEYKPLFAPTRRDGGKKCLPFPIPEAQELKYKPCDYHWMCPTFKI